MERISRLIDDAVNAARASDARSATRAIGYLAVEPPEDVVAAVGMRILDKSDSGAEAPLARTPFLPDPTVGRRLIAALESGDADRVLEVVGPNYSRLLTAMVLTLAALEQD